MKIRRKLYSDKDNKVSGGLVGLSGLGILGSIKRNKLTGLEKLHYSADSNFIDNIRENGIKSEYASNPNNITNTALKDIPIDQKQGKVYLAKKKHIADNVGSNRDKLKLKGHSGKSKTLKVNIPYEDLKQMNIVDNPELLGAKNERDFILKRYKKKLSKMSKDERDKLSKKDKKGLIKLIKKQYKGLNSDGTLTIQGDVSSKYIKGSKNYGKYGAKDFIKYVKNNPKRFGKESAKIIGGLSLVGSGVYLYNKDKKK